MSGVFGRGGADFKPGYLALHERGELVARADAAREVLRCCTLCPRKCRANRAEGEFGECGTGPDAVVSSYGVHLGEESVLIGRRGSGTIFMAGCSLKCVFCQNYDISQHRRGQETTTRRLAEMTLELQDQGCLNINLVTPTHQLPAILDALDVAADLGLRVPVVYNCGGYETVQTLGIVDGVVDIYMPDIKYGDNAAGMRYSGVPDYWDRCREALREMHRQVGDLQVREVTAPGGGKMRVAARGLMVRHLVMPNNQAHTSEVACFLAEEISRDTYINNMAQYQPVFEALNYPEISRSFTQEELQDAHKEMRRAGLHRFAE